MKTLVDQVGASHQKLIVPGRMAFLFYREKDSGEPVLVHWIGFDLKPSHSGKAPRRKAAIEQEQESLDWGGGLKPVTVPSR